MALIADMVDLHSHLLPHLDDGPATMAESLDMCRLYEAEGVRTVVATPHMCPPAFSPTPEDVRLAAMQLSEACSHSGIGLRILPGADVRLQPEFLPALDAGRVLTVADNGRYLMLELPPQSVPRMEDVLFQLAVRKITPVLTHPERNIELARKHGRLAELVERGCLVQITGGALLGAFGSSVRRAAERFLRLGLAHAVASDAHSPRGPRRPEFSRVVERLVSLVGLDGALELLSANPARIIRGETLRCAASERAQRPNGYAAAQARTF